MCEEKSQSVRDIKTPFVNPVNEGDQSRIGRRGSPVEMILTNGRVVDTRRSTLNPYNLPKFPRRVETAVSRIAQTQHTHHETHAHTNAGGYSYRRLNWGRSSIILYLYATMAAADESERTPDSHCFWCM